MAKKSKSGRGHLARDLVTLVRAYDRINLAQALMREASAILDDDRLKLPQLSMVRGRVHNALTYATAATAPFDEAFEEDPCKALGDFSREYLDMTKASYKGGLGEVD